MTADRVNVAGVDLSGRTVGTTAVAVLQGNVDERPRVVSLDTRTHLRDDRKLTGVLREHRPAVVAVDAPLVLPHAVMCANDACPRCFPPDGSVPAVAGRCLESVTGWTATAHVGRPPMPLAMLAGIAFRGIYLARSLRRSGLDVIETWPMGVYRRILALSGPTELEDGGDAWRRQLVGRVVRGVDGHCLAGSNSERDQLDAVAAAFAAWCCVTDRHELIDGGCEDEGAIVIPGLTAITNASG